MNSSPRPILVVEDEQDIREAVSDLLEMEGYAVATACNGQEALRMLDGPADPCLILLDVMMPVMDGHTFMERLRADGAHQHIPVVITSASPQVPEGARW